MIPEILFLALLLALICIGVTGIYPGGIIVPGYLVLFVDQPIRLLATLVVAAVATAIYRLACRYWILFGSRRFVFLLLTAATLTMGSYQLLPALLPAIPEVRVIGLVVPGLIANHFERQGIAVTTLALLSVTAAAYFAGVLWRALMM